MLKHPFVSAVTVSILVVLLATNPSNGAEETIKFCDDTDLFIVYQRNYFEQNCNLASEDHSKASIDKMLKEIVDQVLPDGSASAVYVSYSPKQPNNFFSCKNRMTTITIRPYRYNREEYKKAYGNELTNIGNGIAETNLLPFSEAPKRNFELIVSKLKCTPRRLLYFVENIRDEEKPDNPPTVVLKSDSKVNFVGQVSHPFTSSIWNPQLVLGAWSSQVYNKKLKDISQSEFALKYQHIQTSIESSIRENWNIREPLVRCVWTSVKIPELDVYYKLSTPLRQMTDISTPATSGTIKLYCLTETEFLDAKISAATKWREKTIRIELNSPLKTYDPQPRRYDSVFPSTFASTAVGIVGVVVGGSLMNYYDGRCYKEDGYQCAGRSDSRYPLALTVISAAVTVGSLIPLVVRSAIFSTRWSPKK